MHDSQPKQLALDRWHTKLAILGGLVILVAHFKDLHSGTTIHDIQVIFRKSKAADVLTRRAERFFLSQEVFHFYDKALKAEDIDARLTMVAERTSLQIPYDFT